MEARRFPNRLKMYRRRTGLSQKQVAKRLGLRDTTSLSRWEKGLVYPSIANIFRLCRIYRTIPTELYSDLWQNISHDMTQLEESLLAQHEPFND